MKPDHICVCICTYQRPVLLGALLAAIQQQRCDSRFTYSIVVVDNDDAASARPVVEQARAKGTAAIHYEVEYEKNIARARNRAVAAAHGTHYAFIDDDELPEETWLLVLHQTIERYGADGVLGPVHARFEGNPPGWLIQSRLCERPALLTGSVLHADQTRTGNVLCKSSVFTLMLNPFDPAYGRTGGEDVDFFKRAMASGKRFVWCEEAPVFEWVPPQRWTRRFYLKRAYVRGVTNDRALRRSGCRRQRWPACLRSITALACYTVLLPISMLRGPHAFMALMNKYFHHAGRLSSAMGIAERSER